MVTFGQYIRKARRDQRMSQRALAERVGINFTYLSKLENDEMQPPAEDKIYALAKHLDLNADEMFRLAKRAPQELSELAVEEHMPSILRMAKDLSDEDRLDLLKWLDRRRAKARK